MAKGPHKTLASLTYTDTRSLTYTDTRKEELLGILDVVLLCSLINFADDSEYSLDSDEIGLMNNDLSLEDFNFDYRLVSILERQVFSASFKTVPHLC